ncbi:MAG: indole-3-glycerol phosphate synthase TrpC [Nitrospirae bacterium]|nr:indole-3-glycerol phosphate synthase TrpC [Nitrospirota bacterium]
MDILREIFQRRKLRLEEARARVSLSEVRAKALDSPEPRNFLGAIKRPESTPIRYICEIKRASPSKGLIREDFSPVEIAQIYQDYGAACISVLTEEDYFQGSLDYLRQVRQTVQVPLLRKDFIFDEYQIYEARAEGADAVLLIAAMLSRAQAEELFHLSSELGLGVLFEVHHWKELDTALLLDFPIIGINNRNLKTLEIDLNKTIELLKDIPSDRVVVSESGINTRADVEFIASHRVDAILIGTALMRADDIGRKIKELFG